LWHEDAVLPESLFKQARTNMPGSSVRFGLGNSVRSVTEPVLSSTKASVNFKGCRFRICAAVVEGE
jgi:hypothetical protein